MKQVLTGIVLCAAMLLATAPAALAEGSGGSDTLLKVCGYGYVSAMRLYESHTSSDVPVKVCDVSIEMFDLIEDYEDGETFGTVHYTGWGFEATASGTQLNLALLKAQNFEEMIIICVEYDISCGTCNLDIVSFECPGKWHSGRNTTPY